MDSPSEATTAAPPGVRQQEAVAELGQRALESDDLDELLHDAAVAVVETLDTEYAEVLELRPGGDEVALRQGAGWRDGLVGSTTAPAGPDWQAGYTIRSEGPVIVEHLPTEERFAAPDLLEDRGVVSCVNVVIGSPAEPWGVLGAHATERREFTERDATFVQSVANVLAAAIDRVETDRRLQEREVQLDLATEAASIGLWTWDVQADVVTADEYLAETYGLDPAEAAAGAPMEAFYEPIHEDDTEETWEQLQRAVEGTGELATEYRVRDATGDLTWVSARGAVEYDDGEPVRLHGAVTDITERKRREQALEESEARYRNLFTSITDAYCVIERIDSPPEEPTDFRYVEANAAFEEHTGIPDVVGETLRGVVEAPQEWVDVYDSVVQTGEDVRFERELVAQERFLECHAFPIGDPSSGQVGVIFRDITEHKEREQQLEALIEQLEASNERLEQFAYAASHDLQEPLRMISSYLQLIERRADDELSEDFREYLEFAVDGADRMREMVAGLLEYSRIETQGDQFDPVDLDAALEEVLADLQLQIEDSGAEVTVEELPRVEGDASQLRQVFQNLLENAIEYSDDAPAVHVSAERSDDEWIVSVRDGGIGIPPGDQERVFQVFQRLHAADAHDGTGIGLALVERIVERHGGDIWIDSEPGEGSTFSIALPAASDREP